MLKVYYGYLNRAPSSRLDAIESADRTSPTGFDVKTVRLYEKIVRLRQQMRGLEQIRKQLVKQPDKQLSVTDQNSRSVTSDGKRTGTVGYNVQPPWTRSIT
ncbi:hypothetical protein AYM40_30495 [Paraburkholderia phytofirmans OLGA172]|uniref:Transposase n=1 Tax=Paraburkholderia phytofirmans OLGA172 TaxID=1417228 RepID=A0A160FU30_9BURK|nr:hypothetical protein AYM40_30495 [Paraburkholderia phytofirmans OLGA172]